MTRVVQIVQHLRPGGIETLVLELLKHSLPGQDVHLVSLEGSTAELIAAWPRLGPFADRLHGLSKPPGVTPGLVFRLAGLLRGLKADAVHTHHIGPLVYGGLAARLAGVRRIVHTEHDAWHLKSARRRRLQKLMLCLVRPTLVADAEFVADALRATFPGRPVQVIINGIDTNRFRPGDQGAARRHLGLPEQAPVIGCAARLETVKAVDLLLDAFVRVPPPTILAIAGTGSQAASLAAQANGLGLAGRVHFLGHIDDMSQFYQALDVFCLASRAEGLPLSLMEAQATGVPAIAPDVGGVRDALCPLTGRLVTPGDVDALGWVLAAAAQTARHAAAPVTAPPAARPSAPLDPRIFIVAHRDIAGMVLAYASLYGA